MNILGISCYYHDSAAVLIKDGELIAAAEEERFTRKKHDNSFPSNAIDYCLNEGGLKISEIDKVCFHEKPIQKFDRILTTAGRSFPHGFQFFSHAIPEWLKTKLRIKKKIHKKLETKPPIEFSQHHESHAASAFFPSPFKEAAILTIDGVGEWKTNQIWHGKEEEIKPLKHIDFPDSLGLLYSTITAFLGFRVNNGEYKLMGLASYGEPTYREEFKDIIEVEEDGSYELNQKYFAYQHSRKMWGKKLEDRLGKPRNQEQEINERHQNIAATVQKITEEIILKQVKYAKKLTDSENLCLAGGVALNCVANGKIRKKSDFDNIWVQPAAGDDGGALGTALISANSSHIRMDDVYYGPSYSSERIRNSLEESDLSYERLDKEELADRAASILDNNEVLSLFQGRMEWGPRALGNRSILANPTDKEMIDKLNKKVKFRESFRPFAPTVLNKYASEYFDIKGDSPFMLFTFDVRDDARKEIPAVTHTDGTSRIQTLERSTNPLYYDVIDSFRERTGVPVVINTSFNLKGMPIVNTPEEAIDCFQNSGIDKMILEDFLIKD